MSTFTTSILSSLEGGDKKTILSGSTNILKGEGLNIIDKNIRIRREKERFIGTLFNKKTDIDRLKSAVNLKRIIDVDIDDIFRRFKDYKSDLIDKQNLENKGNLLNIEIKKRGPIKDLIEKGVKIKKDLQSIIEKMDSQIDGIYLTALKIPNIVSDDTIAGKDESENTIVRTWGIPRKFEFNVKDHMELGVKLGIIDTELGSKVAGARFNYLMGDAVLLQNALHQFAMEVLLKKGFIPVVPPLFINPEVYVKMARLSPETEIERYHIESDDQYLIGSAEHTLGPIHMDKTLNEKDLPLRYYAFTPAFRREAGSYGKDTKGILRQHQFDKLEMESFTTPENGLKEQDFFISIQEELMQTLEIPYQVVSICTGDMGGPDYRQVDIESWIPSQNKYRETHTSDYMTDYQSRRLNTKVKTKNGTEFVHMNDATVFAMGRMIIAILENYQNEDGSITIPKVLQKWMGKEKIEAK